MSHEWSLTRDEFTRLIDELPEHLADMARFSVATGLRQANVTRLQWKQISLERRHLWVSGAEHKNGRPHSVPLNQAAIDVLEMRKGDHPTYVFTYEGKPIVQVNTKAWRNALQRAGVFDFRWHDLRHTFATWHREAGTPTHELQRLGGWKTQSMVERYAHVAPEGLQFAASRLNLLMQAHRASSTTCEAERDAKLPKDSRRPMYKEIMGSLTKLWAGRVYGTNTGNLFLALDETGPKIAGKLRFLDTDHGVAVYSVEGRFDGTLTLAGEPVEKKENQDLGTLKVEATLTQDGQLRGEWSTSTGTGGLFVAHPHEPAATVSLEATATVPEQFYTHNISVGALNLYGQDVRNLIAAVKKDFTSGRAIAAYSAGGREVTKYADDFLLEMDDLGSITYLKLQIQEREAHGINRVVVVELRAFGLNEVRAQGVNESWVVGKAESLASVLRRNQNNLVTNYKKFGLSLNQIIFLAMLITIPEIVSVQSRAIFVVAVFALSSFLVWLHSQFIPNASIRLSGLAPSRLSRLWPTIASWVFAVAGSIVATYLYTWLIAP